MVSPVASAAAMIVVPSIRPTDDQGRSAAAARDVAQAELQEDPVSCREHRDDTQRDAERDGGTEGSVPAGMPKSSSMTVSSKPSDRPGPTRAPRTAPVQVAR